MLWEGQECMGSVGRAFGEGRGGAERDACLKVEVSLEA